MGACWVLVARHDVLGSFLVLLLKNYSVVAGLW